MRWPQVNYKNRKQRQDVRVFRFHFGGDPTVPFALPANAFIFVRNEDAVGAVTEAIEAGDRTVSVPATGANQVRVLGWFERGTVVKALNGFELLIETGLMKYASIGAIED